MNRSILSLIFALLSITAMAQAPAFPGAEGHGRYVTGGRGLSGKVYHVTSLADDTNGNTAGTLRYALKQSGPRTIVFDVSGVIELKADLTIPANTTIAGQTAPAPGITLRYYTVLFGGNNIIVRFIRFRRGEEKNVNDGADATWTKEHTGIILDHCSFSWSIDEIASFYDNNNFTMQWCALGEALANPGHSKGEHSYGGIWGGKLASFHHNFIAHVQNRAPRFNGARYQWTGYTQNKLYSEYNWKNYVQAENVDFRNCVMYNWGNGNGCYGGPGGGYVNIVNNYYKAGPATVAKTRVTQISVGESGNSTPETMYGMTSRYYINGNYVTAAGSEAANYDWKGVTFDTGIKTYNNEKYSEDSRNFYGNTVPHTTIDNVACVKIKLDEPCPIGEVTTHSATVAFGKVLAYVGASLHRDNVDKRYMDEALNGKTNYTGSAEKTGDGKTIVHRPGIIDYVRDQGSYTLTSKKRDANFDTDQDGIPDKWEEANGLDPKDATDAKLFTLDDDTKEGKGWYNNLEVYLNSLVEDIMKAGNADALTAVDEYYPAFTKPAVDPEPVDPTVEGSVIWDFDEGTDGQEASYNSEYFQSDNVTVSSNLRYNGKKTSDIVMTAFTISGTSSDAGALEENAVKFNFTVNDGYQFIPTNVSFDATRFGTDNGKFSSYLLYTNNTRLSVCEETLAYRENGKTSSTDDTPTPKHTSINTKFNDADAMTGANALVIHLFNIPSEKNLGLANIAINGKVILPTGIAVPVTLSPALSTEYFTLGGQRVNGATKGVVIKRQRYADGTSKATKVIR